MKTELLDDEKTIREYPANLQRGVETVGGHLYLTTNRLVFEPHSLNYQTDTEIIRLNDIKSISKVWTKFLNIFPIFPNSVKIEAGDREYKFVVTNRGEFISQITDSNFIQ